MPSSSKAQQRFMGMVHAVQKGDMEAPSSEVEKAADSMTDKAAKDFASTKHKGLPTHIKKENKMDLKDEDLPSAVMHVSVENTMKGKHLKWQNEQIEIVLNENLDEGFVQNAIFAAMVMISAVGGYHVNHSMERQLKAGNAVELSMGQQIFNGNKLNKDKYVLTVNPKQTQPIKIDTSKSTITLNTSDISNTKIQSVVRDQMQKIDPSLNNQKIDKGSKDAAGKIKFGYRTGVSIGQGADGNYGLRGPGYFGLGYNIGESADVNPNATIASIQYLLNNRTQNNFPLPTNRILWNATGKVCEGRAVIERIKMYENKGGGWREGVKDDEQVFNSIKELYYERKKIGEIKESVRAILKKNLKTKIR